jgi:hypothetical protein
MSPRLQTVTEGETIEAAPMQYCDECTTTTEGRLSNHDLKTLHQQLTPIFKNAILSMIVEGVHRQPPHLRLAWLSDRFRCESQSASGSSTLADDVAAGSAARVTEPVATASHAPRTLDDATAIELSEQRRDVMMHT